ncbi:uncharacterized protein LOC141854473 [Brevipalpus obovatus]|uniref:uncharacterized protein LOC141854473 n=1 Tax=Brevipalpus obovatus TaxID=246614 RepID=UPI003D9F1945
MSFTAVLYDKPPNGSISLDNVVDLCKERLAILRVLDNIKFDVSSFSVVNHYSKVIDQLTSAPIDGQLQPQQPQEQLASSGQQRYNFLKVLLTSPNTGVFDYDTRNDALNRDHVSHFMLRLYCCTGISLTDWFIDKETELLRLRLMEDQHRINEFIDYHCLPFEKLYISREEEEEEKEKVVIHSTSYRRHFRQGSKSNTDVNNNNTNIIDNSKRIKVKRYVPKDQLMASSAIFSIGTQATEPSCQATNGVTSIRYCVRFENALDLIKTRKVEIVKGYVKLKPYDMIPVICQMFREQLAHCMQLLRSSLADLDEDRRLIPIIKELHDKIIVGSRCKKSLVITCDDEGKKRSKVAINPDIVQYFPLCMYNLYQSMSRDHHLRHFGRIQYGLFLKSIGMRMVDLIDYFRHEFRQRVPEEKFDARYGYFFKYIYGQVGRKVDFSCYSCRRIFNGPSVGAKDHHGCPFKDLPPNRLNSLLKSRNISKEDRDEMLQLSQSKDYQKACTKYFTAKHRNAQLKETIYHPKEFYNESKKYFNNNNNCNKHH